jgi:hypothetical protein
LRATPRASPAGRARGDAREVPGSPGTAELQRRRIDGRTRSGLDVGDDRFSPFLVGDADHGGLEHRRVTDEDVLDLLGVDVLPAKPDVLRCGLDALCRKVDGSSAAAKTVKRKKAAVNEVFGVAVEKGYFGQNPLAGLRWTAPEVADEVDPECVPNPAQVARLPAAVQALPGRGPHLYAFEPSH